MRKAFTLIELLVVIAIVAVLATAMTKMTSVARENGDSARCQGNLRDLWQAAMNYATTNDGDLPYAGSYEVWHDINRLFYQRVGWLKWTLVSAGDPPEDGYDGDGVEESQAEKFYHPVWNRRAAASAERAIQDSPFWEYTSSDMSVYACPKFRRTQREAVRSYVMNYKLGSRRQARWEPLNLLELNRETPPMQASRVVLFTEMPLNAPVCTAAAALLKGESALEVAGNTAYTPDGAFDFDSTLRFKANSTASTEAGSEVFGGLHRKTGRLYAHAVFIDGHVESLEFKASNTDNVELSNRVGSGAY